MLKWHTEPQSAGFWEPVKPPRSRRLPRKGGRLTDSPLPELRYAAREWDHAAERRERI